MSLDDNHGQHTSSLRADDGYGGTSRLPESGGYGEDAAGYGESGMSGASTSAYTGGGDNGFGETGNNGAQRYAENGELEGKLAEMVEKYDSNEAGAFGQGDDNYGMGSGRTRAQEGGGAKSSNEDSTAGKLMERVGSLFKSEQMTEKGREKREQAAAHDNSNNN